ncbi:MAG: class I SAM-dependent methyltransferase [Pirellulales bacterium]|nr:class I SAM-dependent methyltransferase [Pirellulales bacterium]
MSNSQQENYHEYLQGWEKIYAVRENPFDVTAPYEWIVELEAEGKIRGVVLDAGCGAGHNTLYLAAKGHDAVGVDIAPRAIQRAKEKANERRIQNAAFLAANLCESFGYEDFFDSVIDIGCFHSLHKEDQIRYADVLKKVCKSGATMYLRTLNIVNSANVPVVEQAQTQERQIREAFSDGWKIEKIEWKEIEERLSPEETVETGAWFARIAKAV